MNSAQFSRQRDRIAREAKSRKGYGTTAMRKLVRQARAVTVVWGKHIIGWRMPDGAMVCKKRRYATQQAAAFDMLGMQAEHGKRGMPRRAYQCEFCGGWHLTSRISIKEE
ncbi:TPA: hypothetical protein QDB21_005613 [Burkholderia vietnamiensis]|nr:hypothetical protein [Burkholderia vietnamiensis]